jgi:hypothetical protein
MITTTRYWCIFLPAMAFSWTLFKCCYPFADFFNDSYTYIQAAADHDLVSYRPIGYSLFLRLVHAVSKSDTFLVTVQYALVQSSCLGLFFFLRRHCRPVQWVEVLIAVFLVLNPCVYYISNYVSSDALFIALGLFWFTLLLRLIRTPTWWGLIGQWILLILIFYTRYVALFYPIVAAVAFLLVRRDFFFKLVAIAGSFVVVAAGAAFTRQITLKETGAPVFSAFSGWQMANNALQIYPWVPVDTSDWSSPADLELARYADRYFKRAGAGIKKNPPGATTAYMWERDLPLHQYLNDYRKSHSFLRQWPDTERLSYFVAWNRVAPLFSQYGYSLLWRHPVMFSRHYLWPSATAFFLSPLDIFAVYNEGKKEVDPVARDWFGYRSTRPVVRSATIQATIFAPFPWLSLLLNLSFLLIAALFLLRRDLRAGYPGFTVCLQLAAAYLLTNACFTIFASPGVFRYQVLPLILLFIFTFYGLFFVIYHRSVNDKL